MKNTAKHSLLIAPLLGLSMISCGDNFSDRQDAGPICYYDGVRYTLGETWRGQDPCYVCTCGFDSKMLCGLDLACSDGGQPVFDTLPAADASFDQSPTSEVSSHVDAGADQARDSASVDVPASGDVKATDAAVDGSQRDSSKGDSRLASERG